MPLGAAGGYTDPDREHPAILIAIDDAEAVLRNKRAAALGAQIVARGGPAGVGVVVATSSVDPADFAGNTELMLGLSTHQRADESRLLHLPAGLPPRALTPTRERGERMPAVPNTILTTLLGGFASHIGHELRERHDRVGRQTPPHPGDHYGRVLAWAWETDRSMAMMLLLDVVLALRSAPPGSTPPSPAYTLEDLLAGLRFALPNGFDDYDHLVAAARVDVPAMYGAPGI